MSESLQFVEAETPPVCPHCEAELTTIEYRRQKLSFGFMSGFAWVIVLTCPHCRKVLSTQGWG
jgi:glutaredoxin